MARSGRKVPKRKHDDEEEEEEGEEVDGAQRRIVLHLGSEFLRVGRSSDLYPTTVPSAVARKMHLPAHGKADRKAAVPDELGGPEQAAADDTHADPTARHIESLRAELRAIMRQYKLRPVSNGYQSANSYNASVEPEKVLEHNDVYHKGWVDTNADGLAALGQQTTHVLVGEEALRLASLSPADADAPRDWALFRPWTRGMLNVEQYHEAYGASAAVQALLNDLQTLLTHALAAPPTADDETLKSPGLGISPRDFGEYSVLLLVPDSFSRSDLRALGTLLLTYMGFAAINVQTEGICAMFGAGLSAACIVDIGATSIGVSCVEEGLVLPETRIPLAYGGRDISLFFGEVLERSSFPYRTIRAEKRLADAALLDSLKQQFATLLPNQVGLNLYDFVVRLPHTQALKYALRLYDEPILAGLLLFHPEAITAPLQAPRKPATAAPLQGGVEDIENATSIVNANASLGGDEAVELTVDAVSDVSPTLGMFACLGHRLPHAVNQALGSVKAAPLATDSPAPDTENGSGHPSPAPAAKAAAPAPPQATTQTQRCLAAAAVAAQNGLDIVGEASRTPLDRAVFYALLASTGSMSGQLSGAGNEERLRKLANNIMCIGGSARLSGLGEALEARVSMLLAEHYTPSDPARTPAVSVGPNFVAPQATVIPPPRNMEPEHLAWKGLAVLAHLDALQELWVTAADWDVFGYRALKEKSLFL